MKTIQKIGKAKFKVSTEGVANSELELDFNPIIEQFKLSGEFLLVHFQARPKDYRQWGAYSSKDDSYRSIAWFDFDRPKGKTLHLDETLHKTVPTAVLLLENCHMVTIDDFAHFCTKERLIELSGDSL